MKPPTYTKHNRPSGNEGRKHPGLRHDGYYSGVKSPLTVSDWQRRLRAGAHK